ncbi:hypothetical protein [Aneurinibacillus terranovensis]|uniref:hypothetical protein n=1 Tax=Aneurinibacillus terranovensis TaxID=278991 RepID=UPI0003FAAB57|nr:hypothetical protein [Aneurinibacillus terranovensis]
MDIIEGLDLLERRFDRLRSLIDHKRLQIECMEEDVRLCFQENDMDRIAQLALERRQLLAFISALEGFIKKWEVRWQDHEVSDWLSDIGLPTERTTVL